MHVARVVAIGLSILVVSSHAAGQHGPEQSIARPQYQSLRYEEDWILFATLSSAPTSGIQ